MSDQDGTVYHVLTRNGDGRPEVDAALERLRAQGVSREASGFHKHMYVTRADQTVLMVAARESPLSLELRHKPGWREPGDKPLQ